MGAGKLLFGLLVEALGEIVIIATAVSIGVSLGNDLSISLLQIGSVMLGILLRYFGQTRIRES